MKFELNLPKQNTNSFMRDCGYIPEGVDSKTGELKFSRNLGTSYTRFHIYCTESPAQQGERKVFMNLHLDQKRPSYKGTSAHAGEYAGSVIEVEAQRLKGLTIS